MLQQDSNELEATCGVATGSPAAASEPAWEAEWKAVDRRLREHAQHRSALDALEAFDLLRAEQMKIYALFGYVSLYDYMERVLGYRPHTARERMRVARALATLPEISVALGRGGLSYSAVRELTRVATAETEAAWLAASEGLVTNQIESLVAKHRPGDRPDDPADPELRTRVVRLALPPEVYALWRQARMVIAEARGTEITDADFLETLCRNAIAPGSGAEGPAHQIAYKQCPDCQHVTQNGAGREIDVAPEVLERASCDARLLGSLDAATPERATTTVTPRLREQVFARDSARCTVPGCRSARNLEAHHIIEQARGGPHTLSNLTLLCSGHHAALHAGRLIVRGQAPYDRQFRWTDPPPIPAGLDPRTREEVIAQRLREIFGEPDREAGRPITVVSRSAARGVPAGTSSERRPPSVAAWRRSPRARSGPPDGVLGGPLDQEPLV
jgi:HNH endonuclease